MYVDALEEIFDDKFRFKPKFQEQADILKDIMKAYEDGYKNVILIAPTGVGKSFIGMSIAYAFRKNLGLRTMYTTSMKSLQSQISGDYAGLIKSNILSSFRGKANYDCTVLQMNNTGIPYSAESSPCMDDKNIPLAFTRTVESFKKYRMVTDLKHMDQEIMDSGYDLSSSLTGVMIHSIDLKMKCKSCGACPYYAHRDHCEECDICLMNLPAFLTWNMIANALEHPFFPRDLNIYDECHKLEDWIRNALTLEMTQSSLNTFYSTNLGGKAENLVNFNDFRENVQNSFTEQQCFRIVKFINDLNNRYLQIQMSSYGLNVFDEQDYNRFVQIISDRDDFDFDGTNPLTKAMKIKRTIDMLRTCLEKNKNSLALEIVDKKDRDGKSDYILSLKPVTFPAEFVSKIYGDKNLFMSATIDPQTFCWGVGLDMSETKVIEMNSPFKKERRKIYFDTIGKITHKLEQERGEEIIRDVAQKLEEIFDFFSEYKGLVHTGSFKRQRQLLPYFGVNKRFLFSNPGQGQACVDQHKDDSNPTVIFGPNFQEGVDLKDDLGRFQVIIKCPFPVSIDPVIVKKRILNPKVYDTIVATTLLQMYGRTTRNENDWSVTIILDEAVKMHILKNQHLYPKYFMEAVEFDANWRDIELSELDGEESALTQYLNRRGR